MPRRPKLSKITGKQIRDSAKWLLDSQIGCSHIAIADTDRNVLAFTLGFLPLGEHDDTPKYGIFAKIGFQSHNSIMQCDFCVDWDMPYDPDTGEVFDTLVSVCDEDGPLPSLSRCAEIARILNSCRCAAYAALVDMESKQKETRKC